MIKLIKNKLYFFVASYFKLWAERRLSRWRPYVIVVTASSGKTTLLHLLESQIGSKARYSHLANSSFGIPFNILGIDRKTFSLFEWPQLFLQAPIASLLPVPKESIYIVEADCDRPGEGKFLATLLQPDMTLWLNVSRTHTQNFDSSVNDKQFSSVERAISHEFGYFLAETKDVVCVNGDSELIMKEVARTRVKIEKYKQAEWLDSYYVDETGTIFLINRKAHRFEGILLPQEAWLSIVMCTQLCEKLGVIYDYTYNKFSLPPGRSTLLRGVKNTTIVDSSYNSNYDTMIAMLDLFSKMPADRKWIVLGDMVELGQEEEDEHKKLGEFLASQEFERLLLIGPRLKQFTMPLLGHKNVATFIQPKDALVYIEKSLKGGETILFKGSRFLEGIIERLLADQGDVALLCRRELVWQKRRQQWGL